MSKIEEASEQIRQLAQESIVEQLSKSNEAETRLLLIDRVLAILGWPLDEYKPEQTTSNGGYTDYRLTIDGQPRLIVEAKRFGLNLPLPKTLSQPQYKIPFSRRAVVTISPRSSISADGIVPTVVCGTPWRPRAKSGSSSSASSTAWRGVISSRLSFILWPMSRPDSACFTTSYRAMQ